MARIRKPPFLRALAALREAFRDCKVPAAVIGGVAVTSLL
jgi:hypothetical protein